MITVVAAIDPDPAPGQVLFGADEYELGDTITVICEGQLLTNDEIWLLYDPTGQIIMTYDPDDNIIIGNEYFYHEADILGTWHAQFWAKSLFGSWNVIYDSYTEVVDTTPPERVTGLHQIDSTFSSISFAHGTPYDLCGIDYYSAEYRKSGETSSDITHFYGNQNKITGLQSGTLYELRVRGVDMSGNRGAWSNYVTMSTVNSRPVGSINYITPLNSYEGQKVSFKGTGTDTDGIITSYRWWSDKDGYLSNSNTFSTTSLSPGSHTIFFKVKDNAGAWSDVVSRSITVNEITPSPSVSISSSKEYPDKDESYKVKVLIENSGGSASGKLYFYENNVLLQVQDISVSKGSQISRTFTRSQSSPGKYDYKAEVVLRNGAGSRSSVKTGSVYVYPGTESINLDKNEYYYNQDTKSSKVALASALNIHPDLTYHVKWYNNVTLKYDLTLTEDESKRSIPGKVGDKIKVELTKPNGNVIDSDNAIIVVEPLNLKIGVIL
ncbi:MAG: fibronectin type III domain-containing protein, partial [ANME-2 cluster archaeon]|nr:fibronectin type III domain-containing protein [ANME-2 cluster archaeon]